MGPAEHKVSWADESTWNPTEKQQHLVDVALATDAQREEVSLQIDMNVDKPIGERLDVILEDGTPHAVLAGMDEQLAIGRRNLAEVLGLSNQAQANGAAGPLTRAEELAKFDDLVDHIHQQWKAPCSAGKKHTCAGTCGEQGNRWRATRSPDPSHDENNPTSNEWLH